MRSLPPNIPQQMLGSRQFFGALVEHARCSLVVRYVAFWKHRQHR
jgi:hypothetical protein